MENMNMKTASVRQLHGVRLRVSWRAVASFMASAREFYGERTRVSWQTLVKFAASVVENKMEPKPFKRGKTCEAVRAGKFNIYIQ